MSALLRTALCATLSMLPLAAQVPATAPSPARSAGQKPSTVQKPAAPEAAGDTIALVNARVVTVSGAPIEKGTVVIRGGRIVSVGTAAPPAGARIIEAGGKVITPGFVESSTQIGIVEIPLSADGTADQASTDPGISAAFNVLDSFNPLSTVVPVTRVQGVTRALVVPSGTGHVLAGQGAVMDLAGDHVPESVTRAPAAMVALLGEAGAGVAGGSRATAMLRLREALEDARDFSVNRTAFNTGQRREYGRGRLDLAALQPVLRGEMPMAIYANRASDLIAAMRLADEFKIRIVLMGAAEGWMVADRLAARKVPVVVKPLTNLPGFETLGATLENAARLSAAGVTIAISTFDTHNARNLRQEAGNAIAYGMDRDAALRAVTLTPAQLWGVADRVGSIEAGKDADLVVWAGDPFELSTSVERVFIRGREMPRDTRQQQLLDRYKTTGSMPKK